MTPPPPIAGFMAEGGGGLRSSLAVAVPSRTSEGRPPRWPWRLPVPRDDAWALGSGGTTARVLGIGGGRFAFGAGSGGGGAPS